MVSASFQSTAMLYDVQKYVKSYAGKTNREVYAHAFHNLVMAPLNVDPLKQVKVF